MPKNYTLLDNLDDEIDKKIQGYMNTLSNPRKSFSLFAGAGSGKTRSLVKLLKSIKKEQGDYLFGKGQRVAVITYTNTASDEINRRLAYDSTFLIATIHSFIWEQIKYHTKDIKEYLIQDINRRIKENEEKEKSGQAGSDASIKRKKDLIRYNNRLSNMENIKEFKYDPNGINNKPNSLSHSDVLNIGSYFLLEKPLFQKIFIQKYPILLIDESQDTHKNVLEAFLKVEEIYKDFFAIGLFGDMMQRIYFNGDKDLKNIIESKAHWEIVEKQINHRSARRIIELNNSIRSKTDKLIQIPRTDAFEGIVRFYLFPHDLNKDKAETFVRREMAKQTKDTNWQKQSQTQNLILEHHMAARRLGFENFFIPLYESKGLINRDALLDGSLSEIRVLTSQVIPLIYEIKNNDESRDFKTMEILKSNGGLLEPNIYLNDYDERRQISIETIEVLENILKEEKVIGRDIIKCIESKNLFQFPDTFKTISEEDFNGSRKECENSKKEISKYDIWYEALSAPYEEILIYNDYINEKTAFDTHQGVKGEEFSRVMAIMDNKEERGWTFNFEKELLEGRTSHTNNLFYVICSRAIDSLALVMYTDKRNEIKDVLIENQWFFENEIIITDSI